ncbi:MAG: hypothetical protein ACFE0J_16595 [Elainellaceae cyanobacterium]
MHPYRQFLIFLTAYSAVYLMSIFWINVWADPFGLRTYGGRIGHSRLVKAILINRINPKKVFVGASSVAIGLNPEHEAFKNYEPVYNLGIYGANFYELKRYFQHAASGENLEKALIGLDFYGFNQFSKIKSGFSETRLQSRRMKPQDFLRLYLSLEALTLIRDSNEAANYFSPNGKIIELKNFDAKNREELFAKHLRQNFSDEEGVYRRYSLSTEAIKDFIELVSTAQQNNIDIQIFLPPSHATLFYPSRMTTYWTVYQRWLRAVVEIHPVWDFSGCNSITTTPINFSEKSYEDPLHFTPQLGNWIIERVYTSEVDSLPSDFGVYVTSENVDSHLQRVRQQCKLWLQENPEVVEWLEGLDLRQQLVLSVQNM